MEMQVAGKVAVVTGGASGIGYATAKLLAQSGAKVALLDHKQETVQKAVDSLKGMGEVMPLVADVANPEEMQRGMNLVAQQWGTIDIVFANAGINGVWSPIEELKPEEFDQTIAVNLKGTFLTIKYAVPYLKKQGGSVIVTASVNGTRIFSNTGATAYSTSKAGQVAMTKMLALELAQSKIRVNVICPGAIETNIDDNTEKRDVEQVKVPVEFPEGKIPLTGGKPGTADQVAELVLFLASDASSHISGTEMWIDGAESLLKG